MINFSKAFQAIINKYASVNSIPNFTNAAGLGVVNGVLYLNATGTPVAVSSPDSMGTTTANVGTVGGGTITAVETGIGGTIHKTVLTLTATPMAIADSTTGGGVKIYTFPEGLVTVTGGSFSLAETTTSTIATTLKAGVTLDVGIGTATAGSGSLTTTEDDIIDSVNVTSSATINVAGAASTASRTSAPANFDGHTTAKAIYLNAGVPTATDIDGDATSTWSGTVTLFWQYNGDF